MTPEAVHAAVERSLPLLQQMGQPFIQKTGCVSCHHNSLVAATVAVARRNGYRVDEQAASRERATIAAYLESWRERALQNIPIAGAQDTMSYLLVGLAASGHPSDKATDAQARWLLRRQSFDGRWPLATLRPPIESNDIEVTAMSMRALQLYTPAAERTDSTRAIARARDWLTAVNGPTTEERAFRLLGLFWSEAPLDLVQGASRELIAGQRSDGGWSQEPSMDSDAYATGQALVALRESNAVRVDDPAVQRGVAFLLRTQLDDGSWFVKSRAIPIQALLRKRLSTRRRPVDFSGGDRMGSQRPSGLRALGFRLGSPSPQAPNDRTGQDEVHRAERELRAQRRLGERQRPGDGQQAERRCNDHEGIRRPLQEAVQEQETGARGHDPHDGGPEHVS